MKKILIFFLILSLGLLFTQKVNAAPIKGTFYQLGGQWLPYPIKGASVDYFRKEFVEMKKIGIDTLITRGTGLLTKSPCSLEYSPWEVQPANPTYTETQNPVGEPLANFLEAAHAEHMKVFLSSIYHDAPCINLFYGTLGDEQTNYGRLIGANVRYITNLKSYIQSRGWSWDDPSFIQGIYIDEEVGVINYNDAGYTVGFFRDLANKISPIIGTSKSMLVSPWLRESDLTTNQAKQGFIKIYSQTKINIIAPQDSMGSGMVTSFTQSAAYFKALKEAAALYPGKKAWANVETFRAPDPTYGSGYFLPSKIDFLKQQVAAVLPSVSNIITWIYHGSLDALPEHAQLPTPAIGTLRAELRQEYINAYIDTVCAPLYDYRTDLKSCTATTTTYNSSHYQCGLTSLTTCEQNLATYLAGKTTGVCYNSLSVCQSSNSLSTLTPSPTQTSTPVSKLGDLNSDGKVDFSDYSILLSNFGKTGTGIVGDINGNGEVDIFDYNILLTNYGK